MAKRIFKITEFEGGENRTKDPRDLDLNECAQAKGIEFDKLGRIRVAGSSSEILIGHGSQAGDLGTLHTTNSGADADDFVTYKLFNGYGIFKFNHDYNMGNNGSGVEPIEISSEFIVIAYLDVSNFFKIGFIDSKWNNVKQYFSPDIIDLGVQTFNPKIQYYYVDGGLRIFDGEFKNTTVNTFYGHVKKDLFTETSYSTSCNKWIEESQSLELATEFGVNRPYEGGTTTSDSNLYFQDLSSADPTLPYNVFLEIEENQCRKATSATEGIFSVIDTSEHNTGIITCTTGGEAHGFQGGDIVRVYDLTGNNIIFNGEYEVIEVSDVGGVGYNNTFTISADAVEGQFNTGKVVKVENLINPELRAKWIYGISYVLDGGQETQIATASNSGGKMSSSNFDNWTTFDLEPKMRFAFKYTDDNTEAWSNRITGFRIYMKNIEGTTAEQITQEWHLLVDTDFLKGQYVIPGTDSVERVLANTNDVFYNVETATGDDVGGDDIRFLSPITYESLNGYNPDETITARYKTAVVANERTYIGNVEQNGQSYPDRILKSPVGAYDVFPESGFIEGVTSDGDSIVKIEHFGDRLFCFKNNTLQIINISDEEEYVEESLSGHGVNHPCQVVKTNDGIAYVNKSGLYLHNGSEVVNLTQNKIHPFNFNPKDIYAKGFFFEGAVPNLGYDIESNKLILVRSSRAADYDVNIEGDGDQTIAVAFGTGGYVDEGKGSQPKTNDIFRLEGNDNGYDFTADDLSIAKFGEAARTSKQYDYFKITNVSAYNQSVEFIDLDSDAFIYDLTNNCFSLRNFAFGANNIGYNMTNFINTNMFGSNNKLLLLKDATGATQDGTDIEILQWEDNPAGITSMNETFIYKTRDIDFGDPAVRKKIYKVYVTFKTNDGKDGAVVSDIQVYHSTDQDGTFTAFDDSSTNYTSANGLYSEGSSVEWQVAELKPTSSINNVYSIQLKFENTNGDVPRGFEINDISIVYRTKNIK